MVPVLAVWVDDALHVSAGAGTRKGRRSEGVVLEGPSGPATRITGTDAYEWLPGGFFLLHHVDVHVGDEKVDAFEVIGGYDAATGTYPRPRSWSATTAPR